MDVSLIAQFVFGQSSPRSAIKRYKDENGTRFHTHEFTQCKFPERCRNIDLNLMRVRKETRKYGMQDQRK